jgi:glycosyltransferase 2 family protein
MAASEDTQPAARVPGREWKLVLVKFAVSFTLLALIVRRFSWQELQAEFRQTHVPALLVPLTLILASNLLGAAQWQWILRAAGVANGFGSTARVYFGGLFLNNFMLGNVGGDVYRIYSLGRGGSVAAVAGATVVDRLLGLAALCTLAAVAAVGALHGGHVPAGQALVVLGFGVAIMGTAAVLLDARTGEALTRWVAGLPLGRWSDRLARLLGHLRTYRQHPRVLNGAFLLSLGIQAARVVAHFTVGLAMGWSLHAPDLGKFFLVIPVLGLLISLPISIGGWGVREWAGMALFAPLGHGGQEAVTLLAVTALLTVLASLVGAPALWAEPWKKRAPVE